MQNSRKKKRLLLVACAVGVIGITLLCGLCYQAGILVPTALSAQKYTVRGIDVSAYQGTIDWKHVSSQSVRFAFVKATEGAGFQDKQFARNWAQAQSEGITVGAYHFFNFDVPPLTQAENFIRTVPAQANTLPPTVDVEFYGTFRQNHPTQETVRPMLDTLLTALEKQYGKKPLLYCTESAYHTYLENYYTHYPIWIRNVVCKPSAPAGWMFWQYTDKGRLKGTHGTEPFVDLNVFHGNEHAFQQFVN